MKIILFNKFVKYVNLFGEMNYLYYFCDVKKYILIILMRFKRLSHTQVYKLSFLLLKCLKTSENTLKIDLTNIFTIIEIDN